MARTVACVIARSTSTRLPLKVLRLPDGKRSMLEFIVERLKRVPEIDKIYVCTSHEPVDDILEDYSRRMGVDCFRGSPDAVIERMLGVAELEKPDFLLRITADNVFTSYEYIGRQINAAITGDLDYVRLVEAPIGATAEVMRTTALQDCMARMDPAVSEYLLLYMFNPEKYKCGVIKPFTEDLGSMSITVDTYDDWERTVEIMRQYQGIDTVNIQLADIVQLVKSGTISHAWMDTTSVIKYPYGKEITYAEFAADMQQRREQSVNISL